MRILIHDFGAYAFTVQLARELAKRGHVVRYVYLDEEGSVKGDVGVRPTDAPTFSSVGIADDDNKRRSSFVRRLAHDARYALRLASESRAFRPDVVFSADCPLLSQAALQRSSRSNNARFVFWLQDLFGEALDAVISRRNRVLGPVLSAPFKALEHFLLRRSDEVIGIAPAFVNYVTNLGVDPRYVHLLPNWAPLEDRIVETGSWKETVSLPSGPRLLYSGTLGLKHDPQVLAAIAEQLQQTKDGHLVVVTEGEGRSWLEQAKIDQSLDRLHLRDFQEVEELPSMLGSADVLLAVLHADASVFSVPSKVLTYMTAGKPILAVIPTENYSSQIIIDAEAGIVVPPANHDQAASAALSLLQNESERRKLGRNGAVFAANQFAIEHIAGRVEEMCGLVDLTSDSVSSRDGNQTPAVSR